MPEQNDAISIAISSSVDEEAAERMIHANRELMDHYGTRYIVDAKFPPHMTLLLSGIARSAVPDLIRLVQEKAKTQKRIKTSAIRIDLDATGFLRTECSANDELIRLHRELVEAFTAIYERDPRVRQSDFSRWTELTFKDGQVISDAFRPHLSIGWVDPENGMVAHTLAESILNIPFPVELHTLELVEIDRSDEVWTVLHAERLQ